METASPSISTPPSTATSPTSSPSSILSPAEEKRELAALGKIIESKRASGAIPVSIAVAAAKIAPSYPRLSPHDPPGIAEALEAQAIQTAEAKVAAMIRASRVRDRYLTATLRPERRAAPAWLTDRERGAYDAVRMALLPLINPETHGIFSLLGDRGRGKTEIACGLILDAARAEARTGLYCEAGDIFAEVKDAPLLRRPVTRVIAKYCRPGILVVDELHERPTQGWEREQNNLTLGKILRERYNARLVTVLISCENRPDFEANIGHSGVSRISEMGQTIMCSWCDLRRNAPR